MKTQNTLFMFVFLLIMISCKKETYSNQQSSSNQVSATSADEVFAAASEKLNVNIGAKDFVSEIDNPYFALKPGTVFHYVNSIVEDGEHSKEHITVTVTYDIKQILGVNCTVVHDQVLVDGKVSEDTCDWYAQDKLGNIWYFGEDTKSFGKHGSVDTSGSFEAGVNGALPGIVMFAHPGLLIGITYYQEFDPGNAVDQAMVTSTNGTANVAYGSFSNCVVTKEFTALEPGVTERKYYAHGVGQVLTVLHRGGQEREELISITD